MKMNTIPVRWPVGARPGNPGACSQSAPRKPVTPAKPVAPQPAVVVLQQDPRCGGAAPWQSPARCSTREYHGPDQGSLESVTALFARGYIESAMRETMLAAVHSDHPLLGMRDVRPTDPVAKFLTSAQARTTAHDYLYAGCSVGWAAPQPRPVGADLAGLSPAGPGLRLGQADQAGAGRALSHSCYRRLCPP